jgi:hypothetical protein
MSVLDSFTPPLLMYSQLSAILSLNLVIVLREEFEFEVPLVKSFR